MANTTNFGWETPDDTDLVKDGAAAMRTLGNSIDTSLGDLKGGTTGQVLAKNSNTDMDFIWTADASGISPTIVDAKGDLIAATAADTVARLAVGTNGQVLTADSTATTGLKWATPATAGGMTLITSTTVTTATDISFTSIPTTYKHLLITWNKFYSNTNDTAYMYARLNNRSTGSGYSLAGRYAGNDFNHGPSVDQIGNNASYAPILGNYAANEPTYTCNGSMWIYDYNNTSTVNGFYETIAYTQAGVNRYAFGTFIYNTSLDSAGVTRVDFIRNSTQTINGTIKLWGLS